MDEIGVPSGGWVYLVAVVTDADGTVLQWEVADIDFDWEIWLAPLAVWGCGSRGNE